VNANSAVATPTDSTAKTATRWAHGECAASAGSLRRIMSNEALVKLKETSTPAEIMSSRYKNGTNRAIDVHTAPLPWQKVVQGVGGGGGGGL
jgi:hypothetical protein